MYEREKTDRAMLWYNCIDVSTYTLLKFICHAGFK